MKKIYLYIIGFAFILTSCESFLREEPRDFISPDLFFNTQEEIESALLGVYNHLHNHQIGDFAWLFRGELGADVAVARNILRYNVYQYYEMESLPTQVVDAWRVHYKAIGDANMVINRTAESTFPESFKNEIIAEASFLRAFYYFKLTLMWGDVPLWLNEITGSNLSEISLLPRTSQKEVYKQIIEDLVFASGNLPDNQTQTQLGRITKWAAKGLLAKVYLFDEQWEKSSQTAQEVISNSPHELLSDFASVFDKDNSWNKELMFVLPCMTDVRGNYMHTVVAPAASWEPINHDYNESQIIRPDGVTATKNSEFIQGWGVYYLATEYMESFAEGDKRKAATGWNYVMTTKGDTIFFREKNEGTAYYNLKWIAFDEREVNGDKDIIHLRLGEIYLILAEAENEWHNAPTSLSYNAINTIRRRAFGDELHDIPQGLSKDEFKRAIIDENKWELGGEGVRGWYLRHWGFEELKRAVESIKGTNSVAPRNLKEHHMLYKIPEEELIKNPNLTQNKGYE